MKRRFQIAKSLVHDPDILILDEPTAGVDVELRHDLWKYLRELNDNGKTILLTTHYIEEAEAIADRVGVIDNGGMLVVDETKALRSSFFRLNSGILANLENSSTIRRKSSV